MNNPEILEQMPHRWTSAGYYWERMSSWGNLNLIADTGDFERTVLGVRGGPDAQRRVYYERALRVLPDDLAIPTDEKGGDVAEYRVTIEGRFTHKPTAERVAREIRERVKLPPDKKVRLRKVGGSGKGSGGISQIVLKSGLGKDGSGSYVQKHPTNYDWRPDIERLTHRLANDPRFRGKIWICTYRDHPPGWGRDRTSFDVWGFGGRGDPLPVEIGRQVFDAIFNDPDPPHIWWTIYRGRMWTRAGGWGAHPDGPPDSDPEHNLHIHVTYLD